MIIDAVREYLMKCPYLEDLAKINVDFLPSDPNTYSVEQSPVQNVIETYIDNSTKRQYVFVFACRMYYSDEVINNINNCGFFEKLQKWLEVNSEKDVLPIMNEGQEAIKIEALSNAYLFDVSGDLSNARYQIQLKLTYEQEAVK